MPSRHQWQASALPVLFGEEPHVSDPWPGLLDVVAKFGALTADIRELALLDTEGLGSVGNEALQELASRAVRQQEMSKTSMRRCVLFSWAARWPGSHPS